MNASPHSARTRLNAGRLVTLGLFATTTRAEQTLTAWQAQALDLRHVSIVVQKRTMLLHMARYDKLDQVQHSGIIQRAPLDRLAGMLVGVGATAVPGLGALLAVGPLARVVNNAAGGLVASLEQISLPTPTARHICHSLRNGYILLALHNMAAGPDLMPVPPTRRWTMPVGI